MTRHAKRIAALALACWLVATTQALAQGALAWSPVGPDGGSMSALAIDPADGGLPEGTPFGLPTDIPVPGDYDGDRIVDAAVYRPSTGEWFVLTSRSRFTSYVVYQWGLPGDVPLASGK